MTAETPSNFLESIFTFPFSNLQLTKSRCGRPSKRTDPIGSAPFLSRTKPLLDTSELSCINCTQGNCGSSPSGYEPSPRWTKSNGQLQNCQNCNENPYRWVQWYNDGGGCFDETNKCFWLREVILECPTGGNPPQPWNCYEYSFLECQLQNCSNADQDGDGYFKTTSTCFPTQNMVDCDDTNEFVHPGITQENCSTSDDDNCDQKTNCEDEQCRISLGEQCDAQCDQDGDGHYKASCGGDDCKDVCDQCFPGYGQPPHGSSGEASGSNSCNDDDDNDCDGAPDCEDSDCSGSQNCLAACDPTGSEGCEFVMQTFCDCRRDGGFWNASLCLCQGPSPIVIDTTGNGFSLTNAANGVDFDIDGDGETERLSWTSAGSDDVWLALDRNGNNLIDNGTELFGNFTQQADPPSGVERNGFLALAAFDIPANGGNGDGQIDRRDNVFNRLRLWRDTNHNGVSDSGETRRLSVSPIRVIELQYYESSRVDEHGNQFRYRARVRDERGAQIGRWAWDVFLVRQ